MKHERQQHIQAVSRVTWVGLWANVFLSVLKIAAGYFGHSRAVLADGVHSLSDLISDVAVLVGVRMWSAPADECHPYGHGRLEMLVTVGIGGLLAFAGVGIAWDAIVAFQDTTPHNASSIALLAAILSIVVKEILFRWTFAQGNRIGSSALVANAWHHRSDAFSSLPAAIAAGTALFFPQWAFIDFIGAIVVAVFILHAAWSLCKDALNILVDRGAPQEVHASLYKMACAVPGVHGVHRLRTRYQGNGLHVDMHIGVDAQITVHAGHTIADTVEKLLLAEGPEVIDVIVHIDPWNEQEQSAVKDGQQIRC